MSDVEMDEQPRRSGRQRKATQQYGNTKDVEGDEDGKSACFSELASIRLIARGLSAMACDR
jgi:hypothetical protein